MLSFRQNFLKFSYFFIFLQTNLVVLLIFRLLSGILNPTSGEFYSSGLNGRYQSGKIRMITNVCPQFDILWDDLSIYDHINLICGIKGLKGINYRDFAYELMSAVNLGDSLDEKISNLSGGMKRRVSIAMATIGNPKVSPKK